MLTVVKVGIAAIALAAPDEKGVLARERLRSRESQARWFGKRSPLGMFARATAIWYRRVPKCFIK